MGEIKIPLTRGMFAVIDAEDFDLVSKFKWSAHKDYNNFYAVTTVREKGKKRTTVIMHRLIMKAEDSRVRVDHINHNGLDNRRGNLRLVTQSQNCMNRRRAKKEGYKGVYFREYGSSYVSVTGEKKNYKYNDGAWRACIRVDGKLKNLGSFKSEIEAALSYDSAAKKYFGEYACVNFPNGLTGSVE